MSESFCGPWWADTPETEAEFLGHVRRYNQESEEAPPGADADGVRPRIEASYSLID